MLTPQAIKDQEFQAKFRGYDAIEVKAYLELLAEDFFELTERNQAQEEEIEALQAEHQALLREKEKLATEVKATQENAEGIQFEIDEGYKHKEAEIEELQEKFTRAEEEMKTLSEENKALQAKVSELENQVESKAGLKIEAQAELETLRAKVEMLSEQNREFKQEGVDFKTTILAAQNFSDNLRRTSEAEAKKLKEDARNEVETFRQEMEAELSRLPKEIEELKGRKNKVKEELKAVLNRYLRALDDIPGGGGSVDDLTDLFESVRLPDEEGLGTDDADRPGSSSS